MMPVMDGLECCSRLKSDVTTSHIPVLMLTACSMDEQRVQGYACGADGYLSKPFSSAVLKARCQSLVANRQLIKELWQSPVAAKAADNDDAKKQIAKATAINEIDSDFYNRFLEIFKEEMGDPNLNVDALAAKLGLERSQFYRKIKALTNYAPVELIRRLRLQHSRKLLQSTDKTISEIAYEIGFSTPAYFSKCYKDAFGETPSEARAKMA